MKTIILIKPYNETQLAHLYEHLYVNALDEFFRRNKLFSYIDYHTRGRTFEYGFTYVEATLYTPEAVALEDQVVNLQPDFSYDTVNGCLGEIVAEERVALIGDGTIETELTDSLRILHQKPWTSLDDLTCLDTQEVRRSFKSLWVSSDKVRTKTLQCELTLDNDYAANNRQLWPLFWLVSHAINSNLLNAFARLGVSHYFINSKTTFNTKAVKRYDTYRSWIVNAKKLDAELEACKEAIAEMLEYGIIGRLESYLKCISYSTRHDSPNETNLLEATRMIVGAAGWREIGTEKNILELLQHTTLQLVYGREKQMVRLASI